MIDAEDLLGRRTLIVGDVGSGKTKLLAEIIQQLVKKGYAREITLIDLAPPRIGKIGGWISEYIDTSTINYLRPNRIYAPRTEAKTPQQLIQYAEHNLREARKTLQKYLENPTKILAINDITIHMHAGEVEEIQELVEKAETFIATAYRGKTLENDKATGITEREKQKLNQLIKVVDKIISL